jgi:predicted dehydrogenase
LQWRCAVRGRTASHFPPPLPEETFLQKAIQSHLNDKTGVILLSAKDKSKNMKAIDRRAFLKGTAAVGATLALTQAGLGQAPQRGVDNLNIALIGAGEQGRVLIDAALRIPGIRFKAVCDIWSYSQRYTTRLLKKYGHIVNLYEDYRELLANEKDLDAVLVASPDWMHAEHSLACLDAGLHVYCEKEMSNSLERAREMVLAARRTGRLLQIGHQRRSNPRYIHAIDRLIHEARLLGRVTHSYAQWNRSKSDDLGWPKKYVVDQATLDKYGYDSMAHFRNWRWYRKYGGGPMVDLGSHQVDLFSWVFGVNPRSVLASGGIDFYHHHEWYDNVMAVYEFENEQGISRAFYQVLTTTKHGGFYENFMGENGSINISEVPQRGNSADREAHAPSWDPLVKKGYLRQLKQPIQRTETKNVILDVRVTQETGRWPLPIDLAKPPHQPHLENFFDAIRLGKPLNCPAEVGYETAVAVLTANRAVEAGKTIELEPEVFQV